MNGERVETFEFASAEEADAAAGGVSANGLSIVTTMADGTQMASMVDWFAPVHFYKAGRLIALYVGSDSDVNNALQEAMGPQFAGGESLPPAPGVQPVQARTGMIAPDLRLTFEGVEYTGVEIVGALSPTGVCVEYNLLRAETLLAIVTPCGTPINMDDMEVVGTGTDHNPDGDASVEVYRPKANGTTDVYTFHPTGLFDTWTRWTAKIS